MIYLPGSRESRAKCAVVHGSLHECIHAGMTALVQFMETGVALRHQATQLLELLVFHYAAFLVYATEREYSAGLCGRKSSDAVNCDKFRRRSRFSARRVTIEGVAERVSKALMSAVLIDTRVSHDKEKKRNSVRRMIVKIDGIRDDTRWL